MQQGPAVKYRSAIADSRCTCSKEELLQDHRITHPQTSRSLVHHILPEHHIAPTLRWVATVLTGSLPRSPVIWSVVLTIQRPHGIPPGAERSRSGSPPPMALPTANDYWGCTHRPGSICRCCHRRHHAANQYRSEQPPAPQPAHGAAARPRKRGRKPRSPPRGPRG